MKNKILFLSAFLLLSSTCTVSADDISDRISDIESRIAVLEQEVADLKAEYLNSTESVENSIEETAFSFTSEGHTFTYIKNEVCPDHEGNDRVLIYFDYSNNTGETSDPSYSLNVTAFQNGIELDYAGWLGSGIAEEEYFYKSVQNGASLPIAIGFSLMDDSDVSIEICPFFYTDKTPIGEYTFSLI